MARVPARICRSGSISASHRKAPGSAWAIWARILLSAWTAEDLAVGIRRQTAAR
jgi:hypothetical protein